MKGNKLFFYFLVGSFIVASMLIYLYRGIDTDDHIYAFLFLSSLIVMFFCAFLLELMFIEPVIDEIIDLAQESKLLYNLLLLSLLFTIVVVLPPKIIHNANTILEDKQKPNSSNCSLVFTNLFESPKSVYDTKLLSKCEYTQPLAKIIPTQSSDNSKVAQNLPLVIEEYMGLFSQNLSFALTTLLAIMGGVSYSVLVLLIIKKGILLIIGLFNSSALKMLISPPQRKDRQRFPTRNYSRSSTGEESLDELMETENLAAHAYFKSGTTRLAADDFDGAVKDFEKAISLNSDNADYHYNLGLAHLNIGDIERAIADYNEVIRIKPKYTYVYDYANAYVNRGNTRRGNNDLQGALADYDEAIKIKSSDADFFIIRGVAHIANKDLASALADFNDAIRLQPDKADAYYNRGVVYRMNDFTDEAIADYSEAIRIKPDHAKAYNNRSYARRIIGDLDGALSDINEAIRIKPDYGLARMNLFSLLRKLGKDSDAQQQENITRELIQKENEYNQACFEAICGNVEKALELLKVGLEKGQWSKQWASREPNFENIRDDPRFKELVGG